MASEPDALSSISTILSANWNSANTDSITPQFHVSGDQPGRIDFAFYTTGILIYEVSHQTEPYGLGASHPEHTTTRVSIDIRTKGTTGTNGRSHLRKCYNECRRIFSSKINFPDSSFAQLMPLGKQDFSTIGFYRYVYDVQLTNWIQAR